MRVLLFAGLAEAVGCGDVHVEYAAGTITVAELERRLKQAHPELSSQSWRVAVNGSYVGAQDRIRVSDEIALIPPVSGG